MLDTVDEFSIQTDNRNWAAVGNVFADTVLLEVTSMGGGEPTYVPPPPRQISGVRDQGLKAAEAIHHQVGNYRVTLRGGEAEVFCYGTASHYLANPTGENTRVFVGICDVTLRKTGAGWRITRFRFNLK